VTEERFAELTVELWRSKQTLAAIRKHPGKLSLLEHQAAHDRVRSLALALSFTNQRSTKATERPPFYLRQA